MRQEKFGDQLPAITVLIVGFSERNWIGDIPALSFMAQSKC